MVNRYLPNYFVLMSSAHDLDYNIQYIYAIYTQYICIFTIYIDNIFTIYIYNIQYNYYMVSA